MRAKLTIIVEKEDIEEWREFWGAEKWNSMTKEDQEMYLFQTFDENVYDYIDNDIKYILPRGE